MNIEKEISSSIMNASLFQWDSVANSANNTVLHSTSQALACSVIDIMHVPVWISVHNNLYDIVWGSMSRTVGNMIDNNISGYEFDY